MKNNTKLFILIIITLLMTNLYGEEKNHSISLRPGFFVNLYKDEVSYPTTHWVPAFGIKVGYEYESDVNIHTGEISFSMGEAFDSTWGTKNIKKWTNRETGEIQERISTLEKLSMDGHITYSYHHKMGEWGKYAVYPGGELDMNFNVLIADYPTVTTLFSLAPSVIQKFTFSEKQDIRFTAAIPFGSFIIRPPYSGVDDELLNLLSENPLHIFKTGNFSTFNTYFSLSTKVDYRWRFLPWMEGSFMVQSRYTWIDEPRPKRDFHLDFMPGINIKF